MNIVNEFKEIWHQQAKEECLIDLQCQLHLTYDHLASLAMATAKVLQNNTPTSVKYILICMDNRVETILTYLACLHLGWVAMPINPQLTIHEINTIIDISKPDLLVTTSEEWRRLQNQLTLPITSIQWSDHGFLNLAAIEHQRHQSIDGFLGSLQIGQLTQLMFTSGTTGLPKIVPIQIERMLGNGKLFTETHSIAYGATFYNVLPLCYLGGWYNLFLIPILSKGKIVLDEPFGPVNAYGFWDTLSQYQINTLWFSPTMLSMLLSIGTDDNFDICKFSTQIKHAFVGMAPLSSNLKKQFEQKFGFRLLENYGLSETFFIGTEILEEQAQNSVGKLFTNIDIKFRDPITGMENSTEGEILIRSPYMIHGYYHESQEQVITHDGYFVTGDLGRLNDARQLFITGRKKEIIIRGGINISPKEIEEALYELPSVQEAAVVGVSDPFYGERVIAFLTIKSNAQLNEADVKQHCIKRLALIKRPAEIIFLKKMPLNSSNKIQKKALKELYQQCETMT